MDSLYDTDYGPPSMKNYKRNPRFSDKPVDEPAKVKELVRKSGRIKPKARPKALFYDKGRRFELVQVIRHGKSRQVVHGIKFSPKFNMLCLAFSEDGKWLCTGSEDKSARIWDVATGQQIKCFEHDDWVKAAAFDLDAKRLCTGCYDGYARVIDIESGAEVFKIASGKVALSVALSPDGRFFSTSSFDKTCRIYDTEDWNELVRFTYGEEAFTASFDVDSERIVTSCADGFARIHEVPEPPEKIPEGEEPPEGPKMKQLDLAKWKIDDLKARLKKLQLPEKGRKQELIDRLVEVGGDKTPEEKPPDPLRELASFEHRDRVMDAKFSRDGQWVVTACRDKQARVWDIGTQQVLSAFLHNNWINSVRISNCGTVLCTACDDGHARVFDVKSEQVLYDFGANAPVTMVDFSPDGDLICTSAKGTELGGAAQIYGIPPDPPEDEGEGESAGGGERQEPSRPAHDFSYLDDLDPDF
eukprot:TRINITY_DN22341_c0_g2_i1.p1 TRINITY_DN22341_c0_g2~~TRINITY_DN22341_c0_g2_i1.p1  ORF type:complete len:471 (-),score=78.73 TRINITY_DN22341_c0_g2_i1:106-1518(-)